MEEGAQGLGVLSGTKQREGHSVRGTMRDGEGSWRYEGYGMRRMKAEGRGVWAARRLGTGRGDRGKEIVGHSEMVKGRRSQDYGGGVGRMKAEGTEGV